METKEYIEKRLEELRQAQRNLEKELFTIRVLVGELEVALDPSKAEQPEEEKKLVNIN